MLAQIQKMKPVKIKLKPLSVNECWKGQRFKTPQYKTYEKKLLLLLKKIKVPKGDLTITLKWGFSSKLADWDNPIKPFQDILQKKFEFDDRRVFKAIVEKEIVEKGKEYIEFKLEPYEK